MAGASKDESSGAGLGSGPRTPDLSRLSFDSPFGAWGHIDLRNNDCKAQFLFTNASVPSCNEFQMVGALGEGAGSSEDGLPPAE